MTDKRNTPAFPRFEIRDRAYGSPTRQRKFYDWFCGELDAKRTPYAERAQPFALIYASDAVRTRIKDGDYSALSSQLKQVETAYGLRYPIQQWRADAAMLMGQWDVAFELGRRTSNLIRTTGLQIGSQRLAAEDVCRLARTSGLTNWAFANGRGVLGAVGEVANRMHDVAGVNFVDEMCSRLEPWIGSIDADQAEALFDELDCGVQSDNLRWQLLNAENQSQFTPKSGPNLRAFEGLAPTIGASKSDSGEALPLLPMLGIPMTIEFAIEGRARQILREAENLARQRAGLPGVGDGWLSETELHLLISRAFPATRVLKHARPTWLSPQHFDVYLPEHNVAIEFQGEQHSEPIEFFGGADAFARQVERDERKRRLSAENECLLIEVSAGYEPSQLLARIAARIAESGI